MKFRTKAPDGQEHRDDFRLGHSDFSKPCPIGGQKGSKRRIDIFDG
jgi:hypothetical protein